MRTFYPRGTYADAHPSGARTVLMPDGVETHQGLIAYEGGTRPLYVRLHPNPFKFAGQASNRFGTMVWDGAWKFDPRIPNGTSGCIFDRDGVLRIIEAGPDQPSQGYRYVAADGRLVTGEETYGPFHGLTEYTYLGDNLWIGQGHEGGGVRVWDGTVLRELEPGSCTFVRASRVGELVAVACSTPAGAVIHQTSMGVLRTLPPVAVAAPPPVPVPIPVPPAPPKEPVMSAPNRLDVVRAVLRDLVNVDPAREVERGQITDEVVRRLGGLPWGRKDRDQNPTNQNNSDDALCYRLSDGRFEIYDILAGLPSGSPRESFATFDYKGTFADGENGFFREVPNATVPGQPPVEKPPVVVQPPAVDLSDILRRLEKLEGPRKVAIRTDNGKYVCAELGGGGVVNATRTQVGGWETFTLEPK